MTATSPRSAAVPQADIDQLNMTLSVPAVTPDDAEYDEARKVFNAMIDRKPAMIVHCADVADVIAAVNFARDHGMLLAVRGGGHNGPGFGTCDGGMVIDLSYMKGVRVDPEQRTARVAGGSTWHEVDHATHAFGLATPTGIISTTGVGGLTLGGGVGYLSRRAGLTIDNLLEADVVLADGRFVTASEKENSDLLWALRGGGGNFGVVTSFVFRLHPIDMVYAGPMAWPAEKSEELLRWYRDFMPKQPDELNGWFGFVGIPAGPPFPEEWQGKNMAAIVWHYSGPPEKAEEVLAPIRKVAGGPAIDWVSQMPHPMLNSMFDAIYPKGDQWYWKADFFTELSDEAIAEHLKYGPNLPTGKSTMHLYPVDGAAGRVAKDATAWNFRNAKWAMVIAGVSPDPADNQKMIAWARDYWNALHAHSAGGAYVNMIMDSTEEGPNRVKDAYGPNYDRLAKIKAKYDPNNLFSVNQNIQPRTE
jgi:FAD/FMN-containing dehydrogenase